MKKFFRHFLFLILCLSCYNASAGTDDNEWKGLPLDMRLINFRAIIG
ncbi:fimbrial protein [Escherichia coli]|nr:fimbrial protein [Escherichia coli]